MDINQIKELLKKYQEGRVNDEERLLIDEWLDKDPVFLDKNVIEDDETEERLKQIKSGIDRRVKGGRINLRRLLSVAAVFLLFAGTGAFFLYSSLVENRIGPGVKLAVTKTEKGGWVIITTPKGLTHSFTLPDGSPVALNASSVIRYPSRFDGPVRPVYLDEGEAYFSVASDRRKPFTVYTSGCATTALGTSFDVRNYQKEHKVTVALVEGKVRVDNLHSPGAEAKSSFLKPHEQVVLRKGSAQVQNKTFSDPLVVNGWRKGVLSFDNASAEEVITSIENRFNVTIENKSNIKDWKYTGMFREEGLTEVLETICLTEGVTYKVISKDSIQIN